ncbi:aminopeptidase [Vibrio zhanjiangensis]|uniref:Aminopeptidase n=1 Tax=Vibrio zhanjiangensis TaxID=1046128 RepID=A0ABQ6F149_9VIBR|nr:DUF3630 family protein [Vibrio zhanjiangensis]GLT18981.1 aminopeptidase [Vibrio zhanjiangensis]
MDKVKKVFGLREYQPQLGILVVQTPYFDFDSFPQMAEHLLQQLSATVVEKQWDADIHSWLIDFEGCQMLLKSEHYSESVWLEALNVKSSREELDYLANLFRCGF